MTEAEFNLFRKVEGHLAVIAETCKLYQDKMAFELEVQKTLHKQMEAADQIFGGQVDIQELQKEGLGELLKLMKIQNQELDEPWKQSLREDEEPEE